MDKKDQKRKESTKRNRESQDAITAVISSSSSSDVKCCEICRTTKTPLWRGDQSGPKCVCNACGIRYRKKRRELLGLNNRRVDKNKKENNSVMRFYQRDGAPPLIADEAENCHR